MVLCQAASSPEAQFHLFQQREHNLHSVASFQPPPEETDMVLGFTCIRRGSALSKLAPEKIADVESVLAKAAVKDAFKNISGC